MLHHICLVQWVLCYVKFAEDSNDYRKQENLASSSKNKIMGSLILIGIDRFKFCENSSSRIFGGNKLLLRWKDNLDKFAENNLGLICNRFQVHHIKRTEKKYQENNFLMECGILQADINNWMCRLGLVCLMCFWLFSWVWCVW